MEGFAQSGQRWFQEGMGKMDRRKLMELCLIPELLTVLGDGGPGGGGD